MTFPIGDTPPKGGAGKQPQPAKSKAKEISEMDLTELLKEMDKITNSSSGYDEMLKKLRKDKDFSREELELFNGNSIEQTKLAAEQKHSENPLLWKQLRKEERKIYDKYAAARHLVEDKYLKTKPKDFAEKFRAARDRSYTRGAKIRIIRKRLREWDSEVVDRARDDIKKAQAKEKAKTKTQAELDPETVKKVLDGVKSAGEAASKAIEEALKKALKDIERFADDVGDSSPEASSVASGASEPRRLNLAVETEPHKQHVVGLSKASPTAEALSVAMSNALLAPYVVHAYKIGTQPIAVLSVPKSEVAPLEEGMKISKTISWFEPDPCWSKQEIDDAW